MYFLIFMAALLACPLTITKAEGHQVHWRSTSAQRILRSYYYEPYAWSRYRRPARLNARDARINQLNPNLRGNDGNLGESLSRIQTSCRAGTADPDSWMGLGGVSTSAYGRRHWRHHRLPRGRR